MPRIPPWLFRQARRSSPDLATLLPACRDLQSARNELRWIRNHVEETIQSVNPRLVSNLCRRRGRGEPLQYVLGSQPFGPLDIKCRPGVLIPRQETEAYTSHLVDLIKSGKLLGVKPQKHDDGLNVIDFCTGTGCIPLLLFSSLHRWFKTLSVRGMDISPTAVQLAEENIVRNINTGSIPKPAEDQSLEILRGDIFKEVDIQSLASTRWDIMISNPPYISRNNWNYGRGNLGFSVRKYEPKLALVPNDDSLVPPGWVHEDLFYARLLELAERLGPRVVLLEVGDQGQARRVLARLSRFELGNHSQIEVWRDWPDLEPVDGEEDRLHITTLDGPGWAIPVKGSGHIRSILIQFDREWLHSSSNK